MERIMQIIMRAFKLKECLRNKGYDIRKDNRVIPNNNNLKLTYLGVFLFYFMKPIKVILI